LIPVYQELPREQQQTECNEDYANGDSGTLHQGPEAPSPMINLLRLDLFE
jgi:hypothetical protein